MDQKSEKVLLFINKESFFYQEEVNKLQKIISDLKKTGIISNCEIIDIIENADLAAKYDITVLPTLIINEQKFLYPFDINKISAALKNE